MKTLVFNIESSKDVDLAVELIKKLNTPVEVISSPIAESKDPVVTYYEQKVEAPAEVKEISREEEEEELLIKQAAEAEAKEKAERAAAAEAATRAKAEADKKARAAAKAEALKAKAAAEQARLEKEAEEKAEAEAMDAAKAEAEAAAQKAKEERAALKEKRTEPAEGTHISFEMIRIKMMKRIKEGAYTRESMTELLAKYGAKSLSNVKESDFAQLYYDLN